MNMNKYSITLDSLDESGQPSGSGRLSVQLETHDDIAAIIGKVIQGGMPAEKAVPFIIGLKLFADTVRKNREDEPFASLAPHLGEIMKIVKGGAKKS